MSLSEIRPVHLTNESYIVPHSTHEQRSISLSDTFTLTTSDNSNEMVFKIQPEEKSFLGQDLQLEASIDLAGGTTYTYLSTAGLLGIINRMRIFIGSTMVCEVNDYSKWYYQHQMLNTNTTYIDSVGYTSCLQPPGDPGVDCETSRSIYQYLLIPLLSKHYMNLDTLYKSGQPIEIRLGLNSVLNACYTDDASAGSGTVSSVKLTYSIYRMADNYNFPNKQEMYFRMPKHVNLGSLAAATTDQTIDLSNKMSFNNVAYMILSYQPTNTSGTVPELSTSDADKINEITIYKNNSLWKTWDSHIELYNELMFARNHDFFGRNMNRGQDNIVLSGASAGTFLDNLFLTLIDFRGLRLDDTIDEHINVVLNGSNIKKDLYQIRIQKSAAGSAACTIHCYAYTDKLLSYDTNGIVNIC